MKNNILKAIDELKAGRFILITDHESRENEADLLLAADFVSADKINFLINHARGLVTNPISLAIAKRLDLPLMVPQNAGSLMTAFSVSVDAIEGTHTGISSKDRALTMKKLADSKALPTDFERPGHVFPLIAHDNGVLTREGHTEAAIDLLKLAQLSEVAVLCETLNEQGEALRGFELEEFSLLHKIMIISIDEIKEYRLSLLKTI